MRSPIRRRKASDDGFITGRESGATRSGPPRRSDGGGGPYEAWWRGRNIEGRAAKLAPSTAFGGPPPPLREEEPAGEAHQRGRRKSRSARSVSSGRSSAM